MENGVLFFDTAAIGFIAAFFALVIACVIRRHWIRRIGTGLFVIAFVAQSIGLALRGVALGAFPVTNTYESLVFYGWVFVLGYLVLLVLGYLSDRVREAIGIGVGLLVAAFMALASSPLRSPEIVPLVPVLRSHWLALHVSLVFIGEGFFTVAFVAAITYLLVSNRGRNAHSELLERLDTLCSRAIAIGFPFFTLGGLFFGAIWAKHAWGRYWGWDPKETFMLVTWLVYVLYLHVRTQLRWRGRRAAWIAVLGFLLALFTFAGVNFLIRGLHSYG
ncbi:c-type cytochrome biogenesis protein CcsB [Candidatus Bipolaricaulota bacterium]|nr:c-type cytochrome biogenesis protein CcsB [Candidatus Bipolaricaulota bacterium]